MPETSLLSLFASLFLGGTSVYLLLLNISMGALFVLMLLILFEVIQSRKNELHN